MKAVVFEGIGRPLQVQELAVPSPGRSEVLIRIARCGVCSSDLHMTADPAFELQRGTVLGHEYAGEILEIGAAVKNVAVGDLVAVLPLLGCNACPPCGTGEPARCEQVTFSGGGYAQYALVKESQCVILPRTVSPEDGALVEPLAVGLHAVATSGLGIGARVLVIGAGPIGLATTFWARRVGAQRIVQTASSDQRAALALAMGATDFVEQPRLSPDHLSNVLGGPPDFVFECVGKAGVLQQSIEYARNRGTVALLGLCTTLDGFVPALAVKKELRIQACAFYTRREFELAADALEASDAAPKAMVTAVVSLEELPATFEALRRGTHHGKVQVSCTASTVARDRAASR